MSQIETFLHDLIHIDHLKEVLGNFKLKETLDCLLESAMEIELIKEPLILLMNSKNLQIVLLNILRLTNFMNEGSRNENSPALTFDSVLKVSKMKGHKGHSILFYAVKNLIQKNEYFFNFIE